MYQKPEASEYAAYYANYVNLVPSGDIIDQLNEQITVTIAALKDLTESQAEFRYGPEKWSIKEVVGHMADTERIMAYRLLSIARGETVSLPGYDDNQYVRNAAFNQLSLQDLLENLTIVRQATISLLSSLDISAWGRIGNANGSNVSVRAIATIIAGHELHHRNILHERYFMSSDFPSN